jgi:hypothetical protein
LVGAVVTFDELGREKLGPTLEKTGKWVGEHPAETAMKAGGMFTFLFPALIYSPVLAVFGLGSDGVTTDTCSIFSLFSVPVCAREC